MVTITVTAEIHPLGSGIGKHVIDELKIINNETGDNEFGNYDVIYNNKKECIKDCIIKFPRKDGIRELLRQVLNNLAEIQ